MEQIKIGDRVRCDLDGLEYTVEDIQDRNVLEKKDPKVLPILIGNGLILKHETGSKIYVYEWEVEKLA